MARTIEEIKQEMAARFMGMDAVKSAYGLKSGESFDDHFGMASVESVLLYVFAACAWALEKLFDLHRADVNTLIESQEPHTLRWYTKKAKAFMWGTTASGKTVSLAQDADYYDTSKLLESEFAELMPVKYAVATESNTVVYIKVAGEDADGNPKQLTPATLKGMQAYINEVKDAGVSVVIRNEAADRMWVDLLIYYNPLLLTESGKLSDKSEPVRDTVRDVLRNLPFNGVFRKSDLLAALQALPCVEVADIKSVKVQSSVAESPHEVEGFDRPYSGYYAIYDPEADEDLLTVEYKPYNSVDDV
ncbi:MAG: hypothetical protein NC548_34375 [Lachnospiraceae bacterium]|nr:hypothetical protein [Lachnospiraceae bacterium]